MGTVNERIFDNGFQMKKSNPLTRKALRRFLTTNLHQDIDPVSYVNPYIGGVSQLLVPTFPTVSLPNGMVRVHPDRPSYTHGRLAGLPLTMPAHRGEMAFHLSPVSEEQTQFAPVISYSYDLEKAEPHRYSVTLDDQEIDVDFAPSRKSAIYTFAFRKSGARDLIVSARDGELTAGGNVVSGFQRVGGAQVYLYLDVNMAPEKTGVLNDGVPNFGSASTAGRDAALILSFGRSINCIAVRYGVSYISVDQAKKNLESEIPDFHLDKIATQGRKAWNEALSKIQVRGGSENDKTVFYTALYRTYERMVNISEDGRYFSGFDGKAHDDHGVDFFTDDWSWDTYRAAHPLEVLINPKQESQKVESYLRMARQSPEGWLPTFPEFDGDMHAMNGFNRHHHHLGCVYERPARV